jgi:hypothetical protein
MPGLSFLAALALSATPTPTAQAAALTDQAIPPAERTQIAVLGTAHLSTLPGTVDLALFALLVDRLAAWQPQIIAIESMSGRTCDMMRRYADYADAAAQYCFDTGPARHALAIDGPAADAAIDALLATAKPERTPAERRQLAGLFLASGDPASAAVQWRRLPPAERHADAHLPEALIAQLDQRAARHREDDVIAVALAVKLGLERVHPVDAQNVLPLQGTISDAAFGAGLSRLWNNPWTTARTAEDAQWIKRLTSSEAVLAWYRRLNSAQAAEMAVRSDFAAAAADRGAEKIGRRYLAYWEIRNLRMVANLREAAGATPGVRVLAIVGASHKGFYERYLGQMADMSIVDIDGLLR